MNSQISTGCWLWRFFYLSPKFTKNSNCCEHPNKNYCHCCIPCCCRMDELRVVRARSRSIIVGLSDFIAFSGFLGSFCDDIIQTQSFTRVVEPEWSAAWLGISWLAALAIPDVRRFCTLAFCRKTIRSKQRRPCQRQDF